MIKTNITLDKWQEDFIATKGNKILCTGRQVGKSVVCGIDAAEWAMANKNKNILMIAPTERQAYALFEKTLDHILNTRPKMVKPGKDRPTKTKFKLSNGTTVWCLPVGISGLGIRGFTIHRLYADEASRIPENVWFAVTPMLLTTGGDMIFLSTPAGKKGYYYERWRDMDEKQKFFVSSEEVIKNRPLCNTWTEYQRDKAFEYLEAEKKRMTRLQYAQEYEGLFVEEVLQFFSDELIISCMDNSQGETTFSVAPSESFFLGVDVARMGGDETVLLTLSKNRHKHLVMKDMRIYTKTTIPETYRNIVEYDNQYQYSRIYIDDGGLGVGVSDLLLEDERTRRKTLPINNASRAWNFKKEKKKLMKEDLYTNLKTQMEQGRIKLWKNDNVFNSLRSIQADYDDKGKMKIWGKYTHIAEALVRAAYCIKDKTLNIWVY